MQIKINLVETKEKKVLPCPGVVKKLGLGYGVSTVKGEPRREKKSR